MPRLSLTAPTRARSRTENATADVLYRVCGIFSEHVNLPEYQQNSFVPMFVFYFQCWSSPANRRWALSSRSTSLGSVIFINCYQLIPSVKCHFRHACGMRVMFRCFKLGMRKAKMTINWPLTGAKSYYHLTFRGKTVLSFDLSVIVKLWMSFWPISEQESMSEVYNTC